MGTPSSSSSSSSGGIGLFGALFLVLLTLKLLHKIDISWWWVTAPLWGGFAFVFAIIATVAAAAIIASWRS